MSRSSRGVSTVMSVVGMLSVTVLIVAVASLTMMGAVPAGQREKPTGEMRFELSNESGEHYVEAEVLTTNADTLVVRHGEASTSFTESVKVGVERGESVVVLGELNGTERVIDTYVVPENSW